MEPRCDMCGLPAVIADSGNLWCAQDYYDATGSRVPQVGCVTCGGQGTVGDGGYVACPACGPAQIAEGKQ